MAASMHPVELDLSTLFRHRAKLANLPRLLGAARSVVPDGADVILTGPAPVWLYLSIAHALHGKACRLRYRSPAAGEVLIFDHRVD